MLLYQLEEADLPYMELLSVTLQMLSHLLKEALWALPCLHYTHKVTKCTHTQLRARLHLRMFPYLLDREPFLGILSQHPSYQLLQQRWKVARHIELSRWYRPKQLVHVVAFKWEFASREMESEECIVLQWNRWLICETTPTSVCRPRRSRRNKKMHTVIWPRDCRNRVPKSLLVSR